MFGEVWKWAGQFRKSIPGSGCRRRQEQAANPIATGLDDDDCAGQLGGDMAREHGNELAVRGLEQDWRSPYNHHRGNRARPSVDGAAEVEIAGDENTLLLRSDIKELAVRRAGLT